ncbi:MAG TPA: MFS transporter [Thermoplasmata archaeon]
MGQNDLLSLSLYSFLASNRTGVFVVYFPLFMVDQKGATVPVALAFLSAAFVFGSLIGPLAGRWSDRVGRRRPFLLGGELAALPLFLVVAVVPGYLLAGSVFVVAMVVLSVGSPAYSAYIADLSKERERGAGYGLLNAASSGGSILGFVATAFLISWYGYESLFPFVSAAMVGTVVVVLFLVPDRSVTPGLVRQSWASYRPLLTFSLLVSIRSLGAGAVGTFVGVLAFELGAAPWQIAIVAISGLLTGLLVSIPLGRYVDRSGEIRAIWYGTLITLGATTIFLFATSWPQLLPAQVIRYAGFGLLSTGMLAYVANRALPGHRAEDLGVFSLVNSTLWSVGPLAGGVALELAGNVGLFAFALGTTVVSLVAIELVYLTRGPAARAPGGRPPTSA